ncbi:hypothetical protein [Nocardioides sp.]|uniref:hypothetical protein n=1 Tax=Nocardioides sp. TaxID=35761 RepID=UPI00262AC127|nr:hypothetical protein [Nocardioides sp.]
MRPRLSYANVAATLALIVAVGAAGGGEAVAGVVKKLAPNSVGTANLKNGAVTSAKIKDRSITEKDIALGRIGGAEIKDGSIGGIDIANGSLGGIDIADGSIGSQDIGKGQIFDQNLATGSVNSRAIRDNSITSGDISDHTLSTDDIAPMTIRGGVRDEVLLDSEVGNIAPQTITMGNLAPSTVETLTQSWSAKPISKGSTLTGYAGVAYVAGNDPADKDGVVRPELRTVTISFPNRVLGLKEVQVAPTQACTGTFAEPTSSQGFLCLYPRTDGHDVNVGTFERLDFSDFGALVKYQPPATGWTQAQLSWAYTRIS